MARIRQDVHLTSQFLTSTSTTWAPSSTNEGDTGLIEHDTADFDAVDGIFFEATITMTQLSGTPDEAQHVEARLFEKGGTLITDSTVATPADTQGTFRLRSGDIKANLSGAQELFAQFRTTDSTGSYQCTITSARLIIIQDGAITKTAIYWEIGSDQTTGSGSYAEVVERRRMFLNESDYDGSIAYEWHATMRNTGGSHAFAELRNVTDGASIVAVDTTNSSPTLGIATGLSMTDLKEYTTRIKSSTGPTATIRNAFLVMKLTKSTPLTKMICPIQIATRLRSGTNTNYSTSNFKECGWDRADYQRVIFNTQYESSFRRTTIGVNALGTSILEGSTINAGSENTTTSTSFVRQQNGYTSSTSANIDIDNKGKSTRREGIPPPRYEIAGARILVVLTKIRDRRTNVC